MEIVRLCATNIEDMQPFGHPFAVIGRLVPRYKNGDWTYGEELLEHPGTKAYAPDTDIKLEAYAHGTGCAAFAAYMDGARVGVLRVQQNWNNLGFVKDLDIAAQARGRGAGSALMRAAESWAREQGLGGLMLETQDVNLLACRFYRKCGFVIGAVDTRLYAATECAGERTIFWYKLSNEVSA